MKIRFLCLLITLFLIIFSASSTYSSSRESGVYIDANAGVPYAVKIHLFNSGDDEYVFGGFAFNTNVGYQFNRYVGMEVGYTGYGINHHYLNGADAALKMIIPLVKSEHSINLFFKAGPSYLFVSDDHVMTAFAGVGVAFQISPAIDLVLQAQNTGLLFGGLFAGITYHF